MSGAGVKPRSPRYILDNPDNEMLSDRFGLVSSFLVLWFLQARGRWRPSRLSHSAFPKS